MVTNPEHLGSGGEDATTSGEYERGFAAGYASRDTEYEALEQVADYWYFRANNPGVKTHEQKVVESIIDGMEVRAERERIRVELDAVESRMFEEARALIADGLSDIDVAKKVGLFVPIVKNLRAGVL